MAANEKLTIQALKDHDKVLPKLKASVGQPTNREVKEKHFMKMKASCLHAYVI